MFIKRRKRIFLSLVFPVKKYGKQTVYLDTFDTSIFTEKCLFRGISVSLSYTCPMSISMRCICHTPFVLVFHKLEGHWFKARLGQSNYSFFSRPQTSYGFLWWTKHLILLYSLKHLSLNILCMFHLVYIKKSISLMQTYPTLKAKKIE